MRLILAEGITLPREGLARAWRHPGSALPGALPLCRSAAERHVRDPAVMARGSQHALIRPNLDDQVCGRRRGGVAGTEG